MGRVDQDELRVLDRPGNAAAGQLALALALGASVAVGLWPAIRMARQAPAAALRED